MRHGLIVAAVLGLTACSPAPEKAATEAPAAASANAQTPEAFVRSLYSVDAGGSGEAVPEYDGDLQAVSSARTAALFAEAKALTPEGYIGYPEGHPLVEYEEWGSLRLEDLVTTRHGPDRADVALTLAFTQPDKRLSRVFKLVKEQGRWRLDDILSGDAGSDAQTGAGQASLVDGFHRWIADAKANPYGRTGQ